MKRLVSVAGVLGCVVGAVVVGLNAAEPAAPPDPSSPQLSVELARREVRLLDDLYKIAVVYMNDTYVVDESSTAAGEAARDLFAAMKKKGWHHARLVDATGRPLSDVNKPNNDFEKQAIQKILKGQAYVDQVVEEDGKKYLRAATLLPVVNAKCVLCHPESKVGEVIGAISYRIPIK